MKKRRVLMYIIYIIIFLLVACISYFAIVKSKNDNDLLPPKVRVSITDGVVSIAAEDNVSVYAYTYNTKEVIPNKWYKANGKPKFYTELNVLSQGEYYVWVKDKNGNVSKSAYFNSFCKSGTFNTITKEVYCPYSKVQIYGYNWHVLEDKNGYIKLFMDYGQLTKMNHCDTLPTTEYCYYVDNKNFDSYSWDKSIINRYLNQEFIKKLDGVTLKEESVCSDRSGQKGCYDSDGCGGYLAQDINSEGYFCENQFTSSKVRLLTISEYNRILNDIEGKDTSWLTGDSRFWTMNAWRQPIYAGSINEKGVFIVDEKSTNSLDVRPVIVVKK